ncbi:MAG: hypothetical protein LBQ93_05155 [Treponema sp.]|nr:hypothetical protein [Treponema sp.]
MEGEGTEPPDLPPLHRRCRCTIAPILEGMRDDPSQTQLNYEDWFNRQDEATKLDILGPARYKEYLDGKAVTSFASNGVIKTLKDLEIDRITRAELITKNIFEGETVKELIKVQGELPSYFDKVTEDDWQKIIAMVKNGETGSVDKIIISEKGIINAKGDVLVPKNILKVIGEQQDRLNEIKKLTEVDKLYNDNLTSKQMQDVFKIRYSGISIDLADKVPKENLQLLLKEYDNLLQKYSLNGETLRNITMADKQYLGNVIGHYEFKDKQIVFWDEYLQADYDRIKNYQLFNYGVLYSTDNVNHSFVHEFAHAIDRYIGQVQKNGIGRQLLLKEVEKQGLNWEEVAAKISVRAKFKPENLEFPPDMYGGEFFAEAFTAWRNGFLKIYKELQWLIDFFERLPL